MALYTVVVCFTSDSGMVAIAEHCRNESFSEFRQIAISSFQARHVSESPEIFWDNNMLVGHCGFGSFGFLSIFPVQTTQFLFNRILNAWIQIVRDSVVVALNVTQHHDAQYTLQTAQEQHSAAQSTINDLVAMNLLRMTESNSALPMSGLFSPRHEQSTTVPISSSVTQPQTLVSPYSSNEGMNNELFDPFDVANITTKTNNIFSDNQSVQASTDRPSEDNSAIATTSSYSLLSQQTGTTDLSYASACVPSAGGSHRRSFSHPVQPLIIETEANEENSDASPGFDSRPPLLTSISLPSIALDSFGFPIIAKQAPEADYSPENLIKLDSSSPMSNSVSVAQISPASEHDLASLTSEVSTDKAGVGGKGVALLLELDYSGMSDCGVIDAESLLAKMKPQIRTAIDSQIKLALTRDDVCTFFHVFHDAFVDLVLPPALSIRTEQAVKDAKRESICLNGEMFQGDVEGLKLAMHALLLPLVDGNRGLLESLCLDVLRASSRTASGGDSYAIINFLFRQALSSSGDPCWIVTPAATESKPIRIDINGKEGCVTIWSENCFLLRPMDELLEESEPVASESNDFLSRFRKKSAHRNESSHGKTTPANKDGILIVTQLTANMSIIDGSRMRFLCVTCPTVESSPLSYASLGSGTKLCIGKYDLLGFRNGSPWYVNASGVHLSKEHLNGPLWILGKPPQSFYGIRADTLIPPLSGWVRCENSISLPAPYLTILSHNPLFSSPMRAGYSIRSTVDPLRSPMGDSYKNQESHVGERYDRSPLARHCKLCGLRLHFSKNSFCESPLTAKPGEHTPFLDIINSQSMQPIKSNGMDFLLPSSPNSPDATPVQTRLNANGKPIRVIKHVSANDTDQDSASISRENSVQTTESLANETNSKRDELPQQPKIDQDNTSNNSSQNSDTSTTTAVQATPKRSLWNWRKNEVRTDTPHGLSSIFNGRKKTAPQTVVRDHPSTDVGLAECEERPSGEFQFSIAAQVAMQEKEASHPDTERHSAGDISTETSGGEGASEKRSSTRKLFRKFL